MAIARTVARKTGPAPERLARALTWGADEKVLLALTAIGWLASRGAGEPMRRAANHAVLVAAAASLLPHGMKRLVDQTRPDRTTVVGHLHGVSFSGKREDAFPSGHALHMGALASAAGALPAGPRRVVRTLAIGLSLTRVAVLAHWASDVVAGFAVGMALERFLRCWTGFPAERGSCRSGPEGPYRGRQAIERQEQCRMTEYVVRFLVGGIVVSAFSMLGDMLRPKSFAGLFGAAPSVALATLGIAVYMHGAGYAARQTWAMTAGAVALAVYGGAVCHLLMRARFRVASATLVAVVVWLVVAFGLLAVAGGLT